MFRVQNAIIADDVAHAQFACNLHLCKGACCVVGEAGAPVERGEVAALRRAYDTVKGELRDRAREEVEQNGLIQGKKNDLELSCTDGRECVFVTYDQHNVAICAIQKAQMEGRLDWPKPVSCHLFPLRITRIAGTDYINFEYIPELCSAGCENGKSEGVYLSDFSEPALVRAYGKNWYEEFNQACKAIRQKEVSAV